MQNIVPLKDAWIQAKETQLADPDLTDEEKSILRRSSVQDVINELNSMNAQNAKDSKLRTFSSSIQSYAKVAQYVGPLMEPLSSVDPYGVLSLIWGYVRLVLGVCKRYAKT